MLLYGFFKQAFNIVRSWSHSMLLSLTYVDNMGCGQEISSFIDLWICWMASISFHLSSFPFPPPPTSNKC